MGQNRAGWLLVVLGATLVALSALADPIGLGDGNGIGWKQGAGMVVGGVLLLAGLALMYVKRGESGSRSPQAES
jgi:hypothetical protein